MKKKKRYTDSPEPASEKDKKTREWERVAIAVAFLFLLILGISSFFPKERLWGVNQLSYYPLWVRGLLMVVGFLAFVPVVNLSLQRFLKKSVIPAFSFLVEEHKYLGYPVIILLCIIFFYLFRTRTHFLGDGVQIISNINSGTLVVKWTQPLSVWIYLFAFDLLNKLSHFDGAVVYALISYLCGVIFVFFALRLAQLLGKTTSTKLFIFLSLLLMGGTELFLGYAEHYPIFYSGILIYLFYSIKCLKGETKIFLPLLIFFILLPTHFFALYLFPSAIFLFLYAGGEEKAKPILKTKKIWILLSALILIFVALAFYFWKTGRYSLGYFVPLFKGGYYTPGYTLFSPPHFLDFLNQQLLVSPVGFLLFLIFLTLRPQGWDSKDKILVFLLLVSATQLFFNFVLDAGLGASRDWDLFASVGLGYTVLALYLFSRVPPNPKISYLKLALTITILIPTLSWMGINASADLSVARFRNLLDLDPRKSRNGHFILAAYFDALGKPDEVDQENKMVEEKIPESGLINEGINLMKKGDFDNAYLDFSQALEIAPDFAVVHWALGEYYLKKRDLEKAEAELMKALKLNPELGNAYADLGILRGLRGDLPQAQRMFERAILLGAGDAQLYNDLGNIYFALQNLDKAILSYQKAIQMNDKYADPHLGLAIAFFHQGRLQDSLNEVNQALKINPNFAPAYYQLGMIYGALGKKEEAISALKKYLELEPTSPLAKNVGELLEELESQ
jgi:tetratricopeptide (TPR) repeat protein